MTNEEKLRETFPNTIFIFRKNGNDETVAIMCSDEWLQGDYDQMYKDSEHCKDAVLDEIRAEIEPKCDRINSLASLLPYAAHREIQELLCEIMDLCEAQSDIEKRKECPHKPCINYEDGCEEWAGCPCVYYKTESEEV